MLRSILISVFISLIILFLLHSAQGFMFSPFIGPVDCEETLQNIEDTFSRAFQTRKDIFHSVKTQLEAEFLNPHREIDTVLVE